MKRAVMGARGRAVMGAMGRVACPYFSNS